MNEIEETFVQTFVARDKRERWRTLLGHSDARKRAKLLNTLAHTAMNDFDPRFLFDKANPPVDVAPAIQKLRTRWERANPKQVCHIIGGHELDGTSMNFADAEADDSITWGAVAVLVPDVLAYYYPEQSNMSRQSFYVLFHEQNATSGGES